MTLAAPRYVAFWHEADIQVGAPHVRYQGVISTDRRNTF